MNNNESLEKLKYILTEIGHSRIGNASYNDVDCIYISNSEKRAMSTIETELYVVLEEDKIKVIGGDWIGYGSWEDFSKDELLEYENSLNKQKSELTKKKENGNSERINIKNKLAEELMNNHQGVNTEDPESIFIACSDKKISSIGIRHIEFEMKLDNDGRNFELSPFYSALEDGIDENLKNELEQKAIYIFSDKINRILEEIHNKDKEFNISETISEKKGIKATLEMLKNLKSERNKEAPRKRKEYER